MVSSPHKSRAVRTVAAVVAAAGFFEVAAVLAGQATGVSSQGAGDVVASPSSPAAAASSGPPSGSVGSSVTSPTTSTTTAPLPPLGTKVAIVGDSLTEGIRTRLPVLQSSFGFEAKIDAQTGRDIDASVAPLKKIMAGEDLVVVALGTNDARSGLTATDADALIEKMLAVIGDKPVLWVNIYRADTKGTTAAALLFDTGRHRGRGPASEPHGPRLVVVHPGPARADGCRSHPPDDRGLRRAGGVDGPTDHRRPALAAARRARADPVVAPHTLNRRVMVVHAFDAPSAAAPKHDAAAVASAQRGPAYSPMKPTIGPPIGVLPRNATVHSAMTRPRIAASDGELERGVGAGEERDARHADEHERGDRERQRGGDGEERDRPHRTRPRRAPRGQPVAARPAATRPPSTAPTPIAAVMTP